MVQDSISSYLVITFYDNNILKEVVCFLQSRNGYMTDNI